VGENHLRITLESLIPAGGFGWEKGIAIAIPIAEALLLLCNPDGVTVKLGSRF